MNRTSARLLTLAAAFAAAPFFIRRRPRVERQITICAAPASIFPFLTESRDWNLWLNAPFLDEPDRVVITRRDLDSRIDFEADCPIGPAISGRIELDQDGTCTRLSVRCVWELARQPFLRYLDLWRRRSLTLDFRDGLARLKRLVELPA